MGNRDLTPDLKLRLGGLIENPQSVDMTCVADLVVELAAFLKDRPIADEAAVRREIAGLLLYIKHARNEIAAVRLQNDGQLQIGDARDELDVVVRATEEATGRILDAAEEVETIAAEMEGELADRIAGAVTHIYEASNFQDLTGQRIGKVVRTLHHIEQRIEALAKQVDLNIEDEYGDTIDREAQAVLAEQDVAGGLLNGPQNDDVAVSQDDVDALFD